MSEQQDVQVERQLGREQVRNHWLYLFGVLLLGFVLALVVMVLAGGGG